jgi:RNA polymerase sigma-70 factor (ECF subfamily)
MNIQSKKESFRLLYENYYAPFCLYAKRFIEDREIREDVVSDVFVSLWEKMDSFDLSSETEIGYVKMCVKNNCLNYLKHQEYEWNYEEMMRKHPPIYDTQPDSIYMVDELYQMLYDTLDRLPDTYRTVFIEHFFNEKTYEEIAHEMQLSVKSVGRYKQKVIELLRTKLKDHLSLFTWLAIF